MTQLRTKSGEWIYFPPMPLKNSVDVIEAPPDDQLDAIAKNVASDNILRSVKGLVRNVCKQRNNHRWQHVRRSKVLLANLLLNRAVREGLF
jgi:hypothetical protein